jgi:DNA-binding LytR/AlgR family response regulator
MIMDKNVRYRDITLFLILIPFINALNYYLTYNNIPFNGHTLFTFLIDTLEGYAAWWGIRSVIVFLDRKMPYGTTPVKRIVLQLLMTSVAGLLIIILLTEGVNRIFKDGPVPPGFYQFDIFIFLIWIFVVNGIYIGLYYYQLMKHMERIRLEEKKVRKEGFPVKNGSLHLNLAFDSIAGFFVDADYAVLVTTEPKKYLLDRSLDKIEKSLPPELFFRLNRQFIVHQNTVQGFVRVENGKLNVQLTSSKYFPAQVQVSRSKAPSFKNWFGPDKASVQP